MRPASLSLELAHSNYNWRQMFKATIRSTNGDEANLMFERLYMQTHVSRDAASRYDDLFIFFRSTGMISTREAANQ